MKRLGIYLCLAGAILGFSASALASEKLKSIASMQGARQNQLIGYGLVVGLDGSGDQTSQTPFTVQSVASMLSQMGVVLPPGMSLQLKNVAAVVVTTSLPSFARPGQSLDVTVSSIGNAKSLRGGTLLMTPLKGADGRIYGMAQGSLIVAPSGKGQPSHFSVGRIASGATVERTAPSSVVEGGVVTVELNESSFSTARRVSDAINGRFGQGTAVAEDGRVVRVKIPDSTPSVEFLGDLEELDVEPTVASARVIVNARTGSVVMNQAVSLAECAVSHGQLSLVIGTTDESTGTKDAAAGGGAVMQVRSGASLTDVVKGLNAIGASPQDLLAILQALKASGSLKADLEVI